MILHPTVTLYPEESQTAGGGPPVPRRGGAIAGVPCSAALVVSSTQGLPGRRKYTGGRRNSPRIRRKALLGPRSKEDLVLRRGKMTNSGEILSSKSGHLGLGSLGFLRRGWKNGLRDDLGNLYRARETQIPPNSGSAAFLESPGRQRRGEEEGKRGGGRR